MKLLFIALFCLPIFALAQGKPDDLFALKLGYHTTNIAIKESIETKNNFFGLMLNSGNTFVGEGIQFGLAKNLNDHLFLDFSAAFFSGADQIVHVANYMDVFERSYTLKGFRIPVSINYLTRNPSKRLRLNLGAGLQFLNFEFHQFEFLQTNGQTSNREIASVNKNEIQFLLCPGLQYRIVNELRASFIVNVGIAKRYTDAPTFSLKYTFKNKALEK